eukprot:1141136-Pelagomonas_calceolata.AAC.3
MAPRITSLITSRVTRPYSSHLAPRKGEPWHSAKKLEPESTSVKDRRSTYHTLKTKPAPARTTHQGWQHTHIMGAQPQIPGEGTKHQVTGSLKIIVAKLWQKQDQRSSY